MTATPGDSSGRDGARYRRLLIHALAGTMILSATRAVRRLGRIVVPLSAVLYVLGFSICVFHYDRRGVPVSALGHAQFVGAGLLFVAAWGSAFVFGVRQAARGWLSGVGRVLLTSLIVWVIVALYVSVRAALPLAGYWAFVSSLGYGASMAALRHHGRSNPSAADDAVPPERPDADVVWAISVITGAILFATWVFPVVPQWLGGGDARHIDISWTTPLTPAEKEQLGLHEKDCLYEMASDNAYLYLMVIDADRCVARGWRRWAPLADYSPSSRRFVTAPRARAGLVIYR